MTRYRRRATEVRAIKWTGSLTIAVQELLRGTSSDYHDRSQVQDFAQSNLKVMTIDRNWVTVPIGAYIVLDSKGFPYPCDAEIFEENYEAIT